MQSPRFQNPSAANHYHHTLKLKNAKAAIDNKPSSVKPIHDVKKETLRLEQLKRIEQSNLQLAHKILTISEKEASILNEAKVSDCIHHHPGTMNLHRRCYEAGRINKSNILLAKRLESIQSYYHKKQVTPPPINASSKKGLISKIKSLSRNRLLPPLLHRCNNNLDTGLPDSKTSSEKNQSTIFNIEADSNSHALDKVLPFNAAEKRASSSANKRPVFDSPTRRREDVSAIGSPLHSVALAQTLADDNKKNENAKVAKKMNIVSISSTLLKEIVYMYCS